MDEIGDMPLEQQIALLRVIQEKRVTRVGGDRDIPVDVRIICATNRDLQREAMEHNFREDLYYRLNVIGLKIPPLRERKDDILPLFCNFWTHIGGKADEFLALLQPEVIDILLRYDWPGNVRELQNVADRMIYLSAGNEISVQYLPRNIINPVKLVEVDEISLENGQKNFEEKLAMPSLEDVCRREKAKADAEQKQVLIRALEAENGNIAAAARRLGISRATFYRKMK